jgi:hypothetical protein
MEGYARRAAQASSRARQDPVAAKTARITLSRPQQALQSHNALATPDGRGLTEGHARNVMQASTRRRRDPAFVSIAQQAPCLLVVAC